MGNSRGCCAGVTTNEKTIATRAVIYINSIILSLVEKKQHQIEIRETNGNINELFPR